MPWYYSDAAIGGLVALLAVVVALVLALRDRYERQLVVVDPTRTRVMFEEGTGKPHRAILSLLSTGNRPTVIRDIRLVAGDGIAFLSYRMATPRREPALPFRLDAPDERVVTLEFTDAEEQRLDHIDVEFLGGTKPIAWPYVRMHGAAAGRASGSGTLTVTPPLVTGAQASAAATDSVVPAPKPPDTGTEQIHVGEKRTDILTPAPKTPPRRSALAARRPSSGAQGDK